MKLMMIVISLCDSGDAEIIVEAHTLPVALTIVNHHHYQS